MIVLNSATDGFNIILGTYATNLAAMITMFCTVRPPQYDDEERTAEATRIYVILIFFHLFLSFATFVGTWVSTHFVEWITVIMLMVVFVTAVICGNWVYMHPLSGVDEYVRT